MVRVNGTATGQTKSSNAVNLNVMIKSVTVQTEVHKTKSTERDVIFRYVDLISLILFLCCCCLPFQSNIYVECSCQPSSSVPLRAPVAAEKVAYKTTSRLGTHCVFNEHLAFARLPDLQGTLTIDVREKPTFDEGISIGVAVVPLATTPTTTTTKGSAASDLTAVVQSSIVGHDGVAETVTIIYSLSTSTVSS